MVTLNNNNLKQRFFVNLGSNVILHLITLISGVVVARIAGPDVVGIISYATSYVMIWSFIPGLFGAAHIKHISEGQDIGKCMKIYSTLFAIGLSLFVFVIITFYIFQKYIFNINFENPDQKIVILLTLLSTVFYMYYQFNSSTHTATMEQARANYPIFIKKLFGQLGRMVIVIVGFRAIGIAGWNLISTIIFLPLVYKMIKKYKRSDWDSKLFKKYISISVPIFLIIIINNVIQYSDKLFLAYFTNTTELGYYSAAMSIGGSLMLFSQAGSSIFFPLFSSYIIRNDWLAVKNRILKYQEFLSIFAFPVVILVSLIASPVILTILGDKYQPSVNAFIIIALATYIVISGMPYGNVITGAGKFYLSMWISFARLIIFAISMTIWVSPKFMDLGSTGLALNLLTINLLTNALYVIYARKLSGMTYFSWRNSSRYIIILIIGFIFWMLKGYFDNITHIWWIYIIPIFLLTIYLILSLFKLIKKSDFLIILDLINLRNLYKYIRSEIDNK